MHAFSPSQINLFMDEPAVWIIKSLYKIKSPQNAYAIQGTVFGDYLERAAVAGDFTADQSDNIRQDIVSECDKYGLDAPAMSYLKEDWQTVMNHMEQQRRKGYAMPLGAQGEVTLQTVYGLLRGRLDLEYPAAIVDVKYRTQLAPTEGKRSDLVQLACYWKMTGKLPFLLEISKGKVRQQAYPDKMDEYWYLALHNMKVMARIAAGKLPADMSLLRDFPVHNPDGYHWFPEAKRIWQEVCA